MRDVSTASSLHALDALLNFLRQSFKIQEIGGLPFICVHFYSMFAKLAPPYFLAPANFQAPGLTAASCMQIE